MAYFRESLVEWSTRWEEVKRTVIALILVKRSCACVRVDLKNLFRETVAKRSVQKCINPLF